MRTANLAFIVEGHGEVDSVPILVRRIAHVFDPSLVVRFGRGRIRHPRGSLFKAGGLERAVSLAAKSIDGNGGLILLLDSEGDCPATQGPELKQRATAARPHVPMGISLAHSEFECWFLAAIASLRGYRGVKLDAQPPEAPEKERGAKARLRDYLTSNHYYSEVIDQPKLSARMDLDLAAARSPSFARFRREVLTLLERVALSE